MPDIRDVIGYYLDLCDECNPAAEVLELEAHPGEEPDLDAYIRPEMLHHTCAMRVSIPHGVAQEDVVGLLEDLAAVLRENPAYIESVWAEPPLEESQDAGEATTLEVTPTRKRHMH